MTKKKKPINTPEEYRFGRPTKYSRDLPQKVFDACKSGECLTVASICVLLDIDRDTYYEWLNKFTDFSDSIKRGLEHRKAHMEKMALTGVSGEKFNAAPWIFLMKNMFPDEYKDKHEQAITSDAPVFSINLTAPDDE